MLVLLTWLLSANDYSTVQTRAEDSAIVPYGTPSDNPVKILGIWFTTGYDLQPQDQYTYVNNPKTIYTDSARSFWEVLLNLFATPRYKWYQSDGFGKWNIVSGESGKNITVKPSKTGITYYQQFVKWSFGFFDINFFQPELYSRVAKFTTSKTPIAATNINVTTDNDYLYNNQKDPQTTFVRAVLTPSDATSDITWSSSDVSLAKVDKSTGQVTANNSNKSGTVSITGTATNSDSTQISDSVNIRIGGGLDDQVVTEGDSATFTILGKFDATPTSIEWFCNGKSVYKGTDKTYTTPKTKLSNDNGSHYHAVITISSNGQTQTITTNDALLTVIPNLKPQINISDTLENKTYNDHNPDNTVLNNVLKNDNIIYHIDIKDTNSSSILANGILNSEVPRSTKINSVLLDGSNYSDYTILNSPADINTSILSIRNIKFSNQKEHRVNIDFNMTDNNLNQIVSTSSLDGFDKDDNNLNLNTLGNPLTINFSNNLLQISPKDISFGIINPFSSKTLIDRTEPDITPINVIDNRRNKSSAELFISQPESFNSDGNTLPATLRYYNDNGSYETLNSTNELIESTHSGESLKSINWNKDTGLKLNLNDPAPKAGTYTTTLDWTVTEGI